MKCYLNKVCTLPASIYLRQELIILPAPAQMPGIWICASYFDTLSMSGSITFLPFSIPTLVREALDPVVNPNAQSMHMHRILVSHALRLWQIKPECRALRQGGSNFAAAYNFDDLNASPCSSVELQADKSNYWMVSSCLY